MSEQKGKEEGDKTLQLKRRFDLVYLGAIKGEKMMDFCFRSEEEEDESNNRGNSDFCRRSPAIHSTAHW